MFSWFLDKDTLPAQIAAARAEIKAAEMALNATRHLEEQLAAGTLEAAETAYRASARAALEEELASRGKSCGC